ncbi:aldo/keto reductase [Dactylosporangium sp. NPDC051485]|uniref:aldo/keto reductase n=1 Tax=Dactylosporangium sp. NPDC051485 TaxID=3154846 RepID=UPI00343D323A
MRQVSLGSQGLVSSAIGLGCMPLSGLYGSVDAADAVDTLHAALDAGITLFDTADVYAMGGNERLLGRALSSRRDDVTIATKAGFARDRQGKPVGPNGIDGRPEYLFAACDASLQRLGVEVIDLLQLHRVDPRVPIEESVGALAELVRVGKVRFIGLSEASPSDIERAHRVHPVSTVQNEYSLVERTVEDELLPLCARLGIGVLAYAPLCRGLLTGTRPKADDASDTRNGARFPRLAEENRQANDELAASVGRIARDIGCTPSQVALAWLLRHEGVLPIPGSRRSAYVRDNSGAANITLTPDQVDALDQLAHRVEGSRYGGDAKAADWVSPLPTERSVARPRIIVTGLGADGRSAVSRDALVDALPAPNSMGFSSQVIWACDELPSVPDDTPVAGTSPAAHVGVEPGGLRFLQVVVMPTAVGDGAPASGSPVPDTLDLVEGSAPGTHVTRSVDLVTVLEGDVVLVLDDKELELTVGDSVVQRGTAHAWRNDSGRPARLAVARVAAESSAREI